MKKSMACILALVLAFSLTTVAYAATKTTFVSINDSPYLYKDGEMIPATVFEPGKTYYYPIENLDSEYNKGDLNILQTSAVPNLRVSKEISKGSTIFDNVNIVRRKAAGLGALGFDEDDYTLFLAVVTKASGSKRSIDVDFTFKLGASSSVEFANYEVSLIETFETGSKDVEGGNVSYDESNHTYDFSDADGRVVIDFDKGVSYSVYVSGQKSRYIEYTNDSSDLAIASDVEDKYGDDASLDFHLFLGKDSEKTFDTYGKLFFPADKSDYIYQISSGKVRGLEADYDSDENGFVVRTKTPGYYVISDKKLDNIATSTGKSPLTSSESESSSEEEVIKNPTNTGGETNPNTGANDIIGLTMSLAVVSLACIGIVTFKKQTR